jgi:hypothetical protein
MKKFNDSKIQRFKNSKIQGMSPPHVGATLAVARFGVGLLPNVVNLRATPCETYSARLPQALKGRKLLWLSGFQPDGQGGHLSAGRCPALLLKGFQPYKGNAL